jgi:DNA-binding transcriptional LysR family regulator
MPSLRALRAFQVAGRHLSFKDAADELYLSASAVSHQVRNLESFLGLDLFLRKTRALELTEAGQSYFEFLDGMFARLEAETHQLLEEYGRRLLRLCVPPFFASERLLPRMQDLQELMPDTDIRLMTQPSLMQVHPSDADLSVLLGSGDWPDLVTYRLFSRKILTACSPQLKRHSGLKNAKDLNGQTLIVHENRPNSWVNWAAATGNSPPRPSKILRFDSMSAVVQAASQGLGIAIVSWPLSRRWFETRQLVRALDEEVETDESFYLAHRPEENMRPEVAGLIDWITETFGDDS